MPDVNVEGRIIEFYQSGDYLSCYGSDALLVAKAFNITRMTVDDRHATAKHPAGVSWASVPMHCREDWFDVLRKEGWVPTIRPN